MFDHENFRKHNIEDIPLDVDSYLMDEKYLHDYEQSWLRMFDGGPQETVGYVTAATVKAVNKTHLHVSWFPDYVNRYHETSVLIPHDKTVAAVDCWQYGEDLHIFLKSDFLEGLYLRNYSVFGFVDAVDASKALVEHTISRDDFVTLRDQLDQVSEEFSGISIVSFGDSLLLKSNWTAGYFPKGQRYTYEPESFIRLIHRLQQVYHDSLGLNIYAVLTQGSNEYFDNSLLHISKSGRHIGLNSLGIPFAQLFAIDGSVRQAIRGGLHAPSELYLDEPFFLSLNRHSDFGKKQCDSFDYEYKLLPEKGRYLIVDTQTLLDNINFD